MSTMTQDETYNGWKNRETWAFNLHWSNDQGLYRETLREARDFLSTNDVEVGRYDSRLGEHIVTFWRDELDAYRAEGMTLDDTMAMFEREVGSWWRVDHTEVGAAVRESLDNEA